MAVKRLVRWSKKKTHPYQEILSAKELLSKHQNIIDNIYHQSRAPEGHFKKFYLFSLNRLAAWVQNLPASQNHHHAQEGGFLIHTLEVIDIALKKRNTKMLPLGAGAEKQSAKKDVWTFAVFTAALLHDIGKTVGDMHVMLYDKNGQELGRWSSWIGCMSNIKMAKYYEYQYNDDRKYQQHGLLPLAFLHHFIHPSALDWLQQESDLFTLLLMTLQGRAAEGGVIADIAKYADSESCARSLASSNTPPSAAQQSQPKSLADKLLDTMRYLVVETDIKINEPGAPIFTDNTDLYCVSKVMMDNIRNNLDKNGQTGVPFDNSRMMDELLQFHIIIPNNEGKAIWSVELSGGGFKKPVVLTMMITPLDKIFIDGKYPTPFSGVMKIDKKEQNTPESVEAVHETDTSTVSKLNKETKETVANSTLPLPPGVPGSTNNNDEPPPILVKELAEEPTKQVTSNGTEDEQTTKPILETKLGADFFSWIVKAVNNRTIVINTVAAKVHVVMYEDKKSLFLVSPKIFKEYNTEHWAKTQKQFGRLKINKKTSYDENVWQVKTITHRVGKSPAKIKGYLIINPIGLGFNDLPEPNKYLELLTITVSDKSNDKNG